MAPVEISIQDLLFGDEITPMIFIVPETMDQIFMDEFSNHFELLPYQP